MKFSVALSSVTVATALSLGTAQAALFDFSTLTNGTIAQNTQVTIDGITATFNFARGAQTSVTGNLVNGGLGVTGGGGAVGLNEAIQITFDQDVLLSDFTLRERAVNEPDETNVQLSGIGPVIDLTVDRRNPGSESSSDPNLVVSNANRTDVFTFLVDPVVNSITFTHTDPDGNADRFRIVSFNVQAVPLPAAAWLFGSVLVGAGVTRRFKKRAA